MKNPDNFKPLRQPSLEEEAYFRPLEQKAMLAMTGNGKLSQRERQEVVRGWKLRLHPHEVQELIYRLDHPEK